MITDNWCGCKRTDWRQQSLCPCRVIASHAWSPSISYRALLVLNDALALLHELRMTGEQYIESGTDQAAVVY